MENSFGTTIVIQNMNTDTQGSLRFFWENLWLKRKKKK